MGVGTELKKMLEWFAPDGGCPACKQKAAMMDKKGVDWCRENVDIIVNWLVESAHNQSKLTALPGIQQITRAVARSFVMTACDKAEAK